MFGRLTCAIVVDICVKPDAAPDAVPTRRGAVVPPVAIVATPAATVGASCLPISPTTSLFRTEGHSAAHSTNELYLTIHSPGLVIFIEALAALDRSS